MIRRFYLGLNSLRYGKFLVGFAFGIFLFAFLYERDHNPVYRIPMAILAILLAITMFFYYKTKIHINKTLKQVDHLEEYEKAAMLEASFILEDRMLVGDPLHIEEHSTNNITKASYEEKGRKGLLHMESLEGNYDISCLNREEAERFIAFLLKKNEGMVLYNIEAKGSGTLEELGKE